MEKSRMFAALFLLTIHWIGAYAPLTHAQSPSNATSVIDAIRNPLAKVRLKEAFGVEHTASPADEQERLRIWQMTGPFGGDVKTLAIDPRNSDRVLIGTNDGQLFRSHDGGQVWKRLRPGIKAPGFEVKVILFDRARAGHVYLGVKQVDSTKSGGVFVSTNSGDTWSELKPLKGHAVLGLVQSTKDPDCLVTVAFDGIYRSLDHGVTWKRITPENDRELTGFHSAAIDPRDVNTIYVGTWHLPWKTNDGGQSWRLAGMKDTGMVDDSDIFSIQIDDAAPDCMWMSACSGIYRSTDASINWRKIQGIPFSARRTQVIYQHPTRPEVIFAGTIEGLWRSVEGGKDKTWTRVTSRIVINALAVHPNNPDRILVGTEDYGVLVSNDGGATYEFSNAGFINRQVSTVVADRMQQGRIYTGIINDRANGGLFVSEDGGLTWSQSSDGMGIRDVFSLLQSEVNPTTLYAGTNQGLFRSDDQGRTWREIRKAEPEPLQSETIAAPTPTKSSGAKPLPAVQKSTTNRAGKGTAIKPAVAQKPVAKVKPNPAPTPSEFVDIESQVFAIAPLKLKSEPNTTALLAVTWDGLFRCTDEKQGWKPLSLVGSPSTVGESNVQVGTRHTINAIATSPHAPGLIFLGTELGLFISRDNGDNFAPLSFGEKSYYRVRAIHFDPRTPKTIYIGTTEGFFRSLNGGETWEQRGGGMPTLVEVNSISLNPRNPDELYLGDDLRGGFFHSLDRGQTWQPLDISTLPSLRLQSLTPDPFDLNKLYVGSYSGGVFVMNRK
jgi:photosystem II stability/assembly factor-like uncharacterized protein